MEFFFSSGHVIDVILAVMAVETLGLIIYRVRSGSGPTIAQTVANMASGAMIMLAVRSALTDAGWEQTALFLLASSAAHFVDLALRMKTAK